MLEKNTVDLAKALKKEQRARQKLEKELDRMKDLLKERTAELRKTGKKFKTESSRRLNYEEMYKRERATLESIIDYNPYSIAIANTEGRYVRINRAFENLFGRPSDLSAYCIFEDPFIIRTGFDKLYRKLYTGEMKILRMSEVWYNPHESDPERYPDVERCLSVVNFPLLNLEGTVEFIVLMTRDITERKTAERELQEERKKLVLNLKHQSLTAEIASRLNMGDNFEQDIDSIIAVLARTLEIDLLSFYKYEANQKRILRFSNNSQSSTKKLPCRDIPELCDKVRANSTPFVFDFRIFSSAVNKRYFSGTADHESLIVPIRLHGNSMGFICLCRSKKKDWDTDELELFKTIADIIANAWERQRQIQARLEAEKEQFEAAKIAEQASRLASIGVMAAGITHEINQPLTIANLTADWLKNLTRQDDLLLPDPFAEKVDLISSSVNRINEIIEHMRSFWAAPGQSMKRNTDLNETVLNAVSLLKRQMHSHGIELEISLHDKPLSIQGNPVHLEQIVTNLTVNAMHALDIFDKDDKNIRLETSQRQDQAILIVEDNGSGLKTDSVDDIFNPFYSTKKPGKGTGLGLAIVKRFVDEHKGSIAVENNQGAGVKVSVSLPVLKTSRIR